MYPDIQGLPIVYMVGETLIVCQIQIKTAANPILLPFWRRKGKKKILYYQPRI